MIALEPVWYWLLFAGAACAFFGGAALASWLEDRADRRDREAWERWSRGERS